MCGVAGILHGGGRNTSNDARIKTMITSLKHRGPDGTGFYHDRFIDLGHARLSIIDIDGGKQPIHNEEKSVWTVFNGEIFNFIELREHLVKKGHIFYTKSDTEVIVHLYEEYGQNFVSHLNGQYAIAIWDISQQSLILARDRIGIHPLFYHYDKDSDEVIFASEIKAILTASNKTPRLNPHALDQLMTFWSPVSPETMFENVYEVSPGEIIVFNSGQIRKTKYWDWEFPHKNDYPEISFSATLDELHDLLVDATRLRLRSDVPVGAYLSGGLDSAVLVAIMHHYGDAALRTFSLSFEDESLDESKYQQALIRHLNTDHTNIQCRYADVADHFIETIRYTESPILRTAPVPMGILSGLVHSQKYKVVLTGEGSDEVLGGYDIFKEAKIRQFWAKNPDSTYRPIILKKLYPYLDISKSQGLSYLKSFFGAALDNPELSYFSHLPRWTTTAKIKEFYSADMNAQLRHDAYDEICRTFPEDMGQWNSFSKAQYIEAKSLMAGYLLSSQGDRMLMKNSVEGRFPFLDHRVIEFANRLHPKYKMKALNEKYILKQAMRQYLPDMIVNRYKQPYRAPDIPSFFKNKTPEYVSELLSHEYLRNTGYFDAKKVSSLLTKIHKGRAIGYKDNMAFVGILSTQAWHHIFIDGK